MAPVALPYACLHLIKISYYASGSDSNSSGSSNTATTVTCIAGKVEGRSQREALYERQDHLG